MKLLGPSNSLISVVLTRMVAFILCFLCQSKLLSSNVAVESNMYSVYLATFSETFSRMVYQSISKPVRELSWIHIPTEIRHQMKGFVDVIAHRLGTSFAAILSKIQISAIIFPTIGYISVVRSQIIWGVMICIIWLISAILFGNNIIRLEADREKKTN